MGRRPTWTRPRLKALLAYRRLGLSYTQIGKRMGCSKVAIAGAIRRHVLGIPDARSQEQRRHYTKLRRKRLGCIRQPKRWTERALIETYAERKARLAREREAAHV